MKHSETAVHAYHLTYREGSSDKFYNVYWTESGVCVLHWGRRGSAGQNKCASLRSAREAKDMALKQVYTKAAKGYVIVQDDLTFQADKKFVVYAQDGNVSGLNELRMNAAHQGHFVSRAATVVPAYQAFYDQAEDLAVRASNGEDFESLSAALDELRSGFAELDKYHGQTKAAMALTEAALMNRLVG